MAWNNRRFLGYVGGFRESPSGETSTPYRAILLGRIAMMAGYKYDPPMELGDGSGLFFEPPRGRTRFSALG